MNKIISPANAPEFVSWRLIQDGEGYGFWDTRLIDEADLTEHGCPPPGHPAWLGDEDEQTAGDESIT